MNGEPANGKANVVRWTEAEVCSRVFDADGHEVIRLMRNGLPSNVLVVRRRDGRGLVDAETAKTVAAWFWRSVGVRSMVN
jgi:hypothetical protein